MTDRPPAGITGGPQPSSAHTIHRYRQPRGDEAANGSPFATSSPEFLWGRFAA